MSLRSAVVPVDVKEQGMDVMIDTIDGDGTATGKAEERILTEPGDDVTDTQIAELMRSRASTYGFLSRLFRSEIDLPLLNRLHETLFPASTGNDLADKGIRQMVDYIGSTWENSLTELAVDYTRTFISSGIDGHSAAYPYESVYTSSKRLLMQDAYVSVLAAYRDAGIVRDPGANEMEDHIALELEFEQILCNRAADGFSSGDMDTAWETVDRQGTFLADHLLNWVRHLAHDMRRFAKTGLYLGLADYLEGYLQLEKDLLEELMGRPLCISTTA